jgi:hypothetical protein
MSGRRPSFLKPLLSGKHDRCSLRCQRTGEIVASEVRTAFDSRTRRRGLLGSQGMAAREALVIAPCQAVHTFGMRFPIDVVFVARDGRVVARRQRLSANRIAVSWRAFAAIELPAGAVARDALMDGDVLLVRADEDAP